MDNRSTPKMRLVPLLALALSLIVTVAPSQAQADCRYFAPTNQSVCGKFLAYWLAHGELAQFGYPISPQLTEKSEVDGRSYTVQYFERAVMEAHPENSAPYDVLLSLLGDKEYQHRYPAGVGNQAKNMAAGASYFPATGESLGGVFKDYWLAHGGLAQFGYPISGEFLEQSVLDGRSYTVQYFERAVMEAHPENSTPYNVLLTQLGTFAYRQRYSAPATALPPPTICASPITPGTWTGMVYGNFAFTGHGVQGSGTNQLHLELDVACDGTFTGKETTTELDVHATKFAQSATCTTAVMPIIALEGKVERDSAGLKLTLNRGQVLQGLIHCTTPIGDVDTNYSGKALLPSTIASALASADQLNGVDWLSNASYNAEIARVQKMFGDFAQVRYLTTWTLSHQPGGN